MDHAIHRARRVKLAAAYSVVAKFGSLAVTLISIPLAIRTLGAERFGIWITITTFFGMFGVLDGGIGNAVINMVADQRVAKNDQRLREIVSSAYFLLIIVGLIGCMLAFALAYLIDWSWAISLPESISRAEVVTSALIVGTLFFINIPLSLATRIRQGLQESHVNSLFDVFSHCLVLGGTIVCWYKAATLNAFLLVFASGPVIACASNSILLFVRTDILLAPRLRDVSKRVASGIISNGSLFLGLQLTAALAFQADVLVVSNIVGLRAAAELGLVNRIFLLASTVTGFIITPLWPAFRDASSRGDSEWVRQVFLTTFFYSILASLVISTPILLSYKPLVILWAGDQVVPKFTLVFAVFVWTNMLVVGSITTSLLHGLDAIRLQLVVGLAMTLVNIPISILLTCLIGTSGVVYGSIISYGLCVLLPYWFIIPKKLRHK